MESVSGLMSDFELEILNVLTVSIAGWTVQSEVGLESKSEG
jgi:hypothetical protein